MNREDIINCISNLKVWKRGKKTARHKPLLLLYMLGQIAQGKGHRQEFGEICRNLRPLKDYVEYSGGNSWIWFPFWHLHDEKIWRLDAHSTAPPLREQLPQKYRTGGTPRPSLTWAKSVKGGLYGGFTDEAAELLKSDQQLAAECSYILLHNNFGSSMQWPLIDHFGLFLDRNIRIYRVRMSCRDPEFRRKVRKAYRNRCAVCGFAMSLSPKKASIGVEAAHIKWLAYGGPDSVENSLALCALHHALFDNGAFTINCEKRQKYFLHISGKAKGPGLKTALLPYKDDFLRNFPDKQTLFPGCDHLNWHREHIFVE